MGQREHKLFVRSVVPPIIKSCYKLRIQSRKIIEGKPLTAPTVKICLLKKITKTKPKQNYNHYQTSWEKKKINGSLSLQMFPAFLSSISLAKYSE